MPGVLAAERFRVHLLRQGLGEDIGIRIALHLFEDILASQP